MNVEDVEVKMLQAGEGDCIVVYFRDENFRILIDGGVASTYDLALRPYLKGLSSKGQKIDILIVTHIDRDHIEGIIRLLNENGYAKDPSIIHIGEIWFNGVRKIPRTLSPSAQIPCSEKGILNTMAANNQIRDTENNGTSEVSYAQGYSLSELIIKNGYTWNKSFKNGPVIKENDARIRIGSIVISVINPTTSVLEKLYKKWVEELKRWCLDVAINDDIIFDKAFEGYYLDELETETQLHTISSNEKCINWENEANKDDESLDSSITNRSSIVILIEYKGKTFLFPGDYPIRSLFGELPDCIDVVKLPHHGSGRNIDKNFIRNKAVSYYLLSTDGRKYKHPSFSIIGNIILHSKHEAELIKNYNIKGLEGIGELEI